MSLARQLAERVTAMRYEDLPPDAVYWSRIAVLDTVGVALAGASEDATRLVAETLELPAAAGACLLLGSTPPRVSAGTCLR